MLVQPEELYVDNCENDIKRNAFYFYSAEIEMTDRDNMTDNQFVNDLDTIRNQCDGLSRQSYGTQAIRHYLLNSLQTLVHKRESHNIQITDDQKRSMSELYQNFIVSETDTSLPLVEKVFVDLLALDVELNAKNSKLMHAEEQIAAQKQLQIDKDNLSNELEQSLQSIASKDEMIEILQNEFNEIKQKCAATEDKLQALQTENGALESALNKEIADALKSKQIVADLTSENDSLSTEKHCDFLSRRSDELRRDKENFDKMRSDMIDREHEMNDRHIEDLECIQKLEETKCYLLRQIEELQTKNECDDADIERMNVCRDLTQERMDSMESEITELKQQIAEKSSKIQGDDAQLERIKWSNKFMKQKLEKLELEMLQLRRDNDGKAKEIRGLKEKLVSYKNTQSELDAMSLRLQESDTQKLRAKEYLKKLQEHIIQRKERYKMRLDEFEVAMDALNQMCNEQAHNYSEIHYGVLQRLKEQLNKMQGAFETLVRNLQEQNEYLYQVLNGMENRMSGRLELDQDFLDFMENVKDMKSRIDETSFYLRKYLS